MKPRMISPVWKLSKQEIFFFLAIFLVFPIVTDLEYSFYEQDDFIFSFDLLIERLVYGVFGILPYLIYYKVIIPYLFEKRFLVFILLIVLFLLFLTGYTKYEHWFVSQLEFLPDHTVDSAKKWFLDTPRLFPFSIIFVLREMLMFTALAYFRRSSFLDSQMQLMQQKQLETELNYLKVQLQPHFFFNTLNNIYALALQQSNQTAPLIAKYAEMMRYILYDSKEKTIVIRREAAFLKNFVEMESFRYSASMDIRFETQITNESVSIEPLLLLPFIENAFKHGIREETRSGFVHIIICLTEDELILEVRNSRPSDGKDQNMPQGIGLENVRSRLAILHPGHQLTVNEQNEIYQINLCIPL